MRTGPWPRKPFRSGRYPRPCCRSARCRRPGAIMSISPAMREMKAIKSSMVWVAPMAIQRLDHEIGVTQPAIAIIPVAPRMRRFRQRGGERRDDPAGLLEIGELERDGGADDGILPFIGDGKAAHPFPPIIAACARQNRARRRQVRREGFVGAQHQMHRPRQHERRFSVDVGKRRIGGQPDDRVGLAIGDVIAGRSICDSMGLP